MPACGGSIFHLAGSGRFAVRRPTLKSFSKVFLERVPGSVLPLAIDHERVAFARFERRPDLFQRADAALDPARDR